MSAEPAEEQPQPRRRERADWRSAEWNLALHWQEPANPFDEKTFGWGIEGAEANRTASDLDPFRPEPLVP